MKKEEIEKITQFKESQDYKDICYMIDHVANKEVRLSCLEDLHYKIGSDMVLEKENAELKSVVIGTKGEIRVRVTRFEDNFVSCIIVE